MPRNEAEQRTVPSVGYKTTVDIHIKTDNDVVRFFLLELDFVQLGGPGLSAKSERHSRHGRGEVLSSTTAAGKTLGSPLITTT
jgi:hypothetical protein